MLRASVQLYKNAYSGLSREMWWLALVMFINRSGTMVIPFLTVYLTHKGYSLEQAGWAMGAFGIGSILGGYIGGKLTDKLGHLQVQILSLLLNGLLFIVLGYMQTLWQIIAFIFLLSSLGEAFRPANAAAIAAYSHDGNRTRGYALNRLAINLGWAIGPAVGGLLASYDYQLLFWADGITCISAALLLYFLFPSNKMSYEKVEPGQNTIPVRAAHRDTMFMIGMGLIFLVGVCFFQMFNILPVYYKDVLGFNEATIGFVLALNGLIIAAFEMVLVYKLENRERDEWYMMWGAFLIGLSFLALVVARELYLVICNMMIVTMGEMLLFPFMNSFWVRRCSSSNRGQYAALYTMSFSAAIVLAPTGASQIASSWGFDTLWVVDFIICTFAAMGFYWLKKNNQHGNI